MASRSAREAETGTGAGAPTALVAPAAEAGATPGPIDVAAGAVAREPPRVPPAEVWGRSQWHRGRGRGASARGSAGRRWRWAACAPGGRGGGALGGGCGRVGDWRRGGRRRGSRRLRSQRRVGELLGQRRCLRWQARGLTACGCLGGVRAGAPVPAEAGWTDGLPAEPELGLEVDDSGELGLLMPGEPERTRRRCSAQTARTSRRAGAGPADRGAGAGRLAAGRRVASGGSCVLELPAVRQQERPPAVAAPAARQLECVLRCFRSARRTAAGGGGAMAASAAVRSAWPQAALHRARSGTLRAAGRSASCHRHRACPAEHSGCPTVPSVLPDTTPMFSATPDAIRSAIRVSTHLTSEIRVVQVSRSHAGRPRRSGSPRSWS